MKTARDHAQQNDPRWQQVLGAMRRLLVDTTSTVLWRLLGPRGLDGQAQSVKAESFAGIGFYARPPADGKPEAIIINIGGADHPVIVATRDEKTRKSMAADLAAGETIVFTSSRILKLTAAGEVLIGDPGGSFKAVALADHTHAVPVLVGATYGSPTLDPTARTGESNSNSSDVKVT